MLGFRVELRESDHASCARCRRGADEVQLRCSWRWRGSCRQATNRPHSQRSVAYRKECTGTLGVDLGGCRALFLGAATRFGWAGLGGRRSGYGFSALVARARLQHVGAIGLGRAGSLAVLAKKTGEMMGGAQVSNRATEMDNARVWTSHQNWGAASAKPACRPPS